MKSRVRSSGYRRRTIVAPPDVLSECERLGLSWPRRTAKMFRTICDAETPVILPDERIVFSRTVAPVPPIYETDRWRQITANKTLHELGPISNICPDWGMALSQGLLARRQVADSSRRTFADKQALEFLECAIESIDAVLNLTSRYAEEARRLSRPDLAEILIRVPALPPRTFHEALQSLRILHAAVWMSGHYHVGLGRLDQYLLPYLESDLTSHRIDIADAEELLAKFFITLNKDSDLYPGVQQVDNGQTIMLGGVKADGSDAQNDLTRMAIRAALYTNLIDPKM